MKKLLGVAFFVCVVVLGVMQAASSVNAAGGGSCGCPKTAPVCCKNCNGTFAYCARSFAFCPECPAP